MKVVSCISFVLWLNLSNAWQVLNQNQVKERAELNELIQSNNGKPLILTPYIEEGRITEAREAAKVEPFAGNVKSYSGFFTVDKRYNSTMFFWYFPAESKPTQAPVLVWLQGGPGLSSLYGLFLENGPYFIEKTGNVKLRDTYWSKTMHVIYIDNPVGTGFSFTDSKEGFAKNETSVGINLHSCVVQLLQMFPELVKNEFYVTGESYAGKFVSALSYTIHESNPSSKVKINLKGLSIGNGLLNIDDQLVYDDYYYQIGLIDEKQKTLFTEAQEQLRTLIKEKNWSDAYKVLYYITDVLFQNTTGFENNYNYLVSKRDNSTSEVDNFLKRTKVRNALHVGNVEFRSLYMTGNVNLQLEDDHSQSVAPWLSNLADNYKVLLYNGQLDCLAPYTGTARLVSKLQWCGSEEFGSAERKKWYVNDTLAGYIKTSAPSKCKGSLSLSLVRNAGHWVPHDQPLWAYDLISRFTSNSLP